MTRYVLFEERRVSSIVGRRMNEELKGVLGIIGVSLLALGVVVALIEGCSSLVWSRYKRKKGGSE